MSGWNARLQRVQGAQMCEDLEEMPSVSLHVLKLEKLTFGKTHVGRTCEEVWVNHPVDQMVLPALHDQSKSCPSTCDHVH